MWKWLLLKIFGPCSEEPCAQPGTQLCTPHSNNRPIYLCPQHKAEGALLELARQEFIDNENMTIGDSQKRE